jgi:hypothetical protein
MPERAGALIKRTYGEITIEAALVSDLMVTVWTDVVPFVPATGAKSVDALMDST